MRRSALLIWRTETLASMDVFRANQSGAFNMMTLTSVLLDQPHVPMRLGQLGLFESQGVRTLDISIERQQNTLQLVQTTERNTPGVQNTKDPRQLIHIPTARLAKEDSLTADEIQGVRALGSETELRTLQEEINQRNSRMSNSIEATIEYHRIGALKGQVLDADGSVLLDLYSTFGVTAQSEVDFDLDNATPASGVLRNTCNAVIRLIEDELGGLPYTDVHAMCSSQFFDAFTAHPEFRAQYEGTPNALMLGTRTARRVAYFGGITFEEYRGNVGGTKYVADNKAHIFPIGVPELFLTRYAPAEWWNTVNTIGLPRYARLYFDPMEPDSKVNARVQTQIVNLCTRPRVLIPATK